MPNLDGIGAIRHILTNQPTARILVLTSFSADEQVFPAIRAGALGYVLKDTNAMELVTAIRQVAAGESFLHPMVARKVLQELAHLPAHPPPGELLTEREVEVLVLVAHGESNQQIATQLGISEATVRKHVSSILRKLHLASRTQAALYAIREGITAFAEER
jgi:NarL family two-component system response regulator LiaR